MGQLDGHNLDAVHDGVAWTSQAWHDALHPAAASGEANLYACAAAKVMAQLSDCHTFEDLVPRVQAPSDELVTALT
jgi:hypothetical protein